MAEGCRLNPETGAIECTIESTEEAPPPVPEPERPPEPEPEPERDWPADELLQGWTRSLLANLGMMQRDMQARAVVKQRLRQQAGNAAAFEYAPQQIRIDTPPVKAVPWREIAMQLQSGVSNPEIGRNAVDDARKNAGFTAPSPRTQAPPGARQLARQDNTVLNTRPVGYATPVTDILQEMNAGISPQQKEQAGLEQKRRQWRQQREADKAWVQQTVRKVFGNASKSQIKSEIRKDALIRVGKLYGDWRDVAKPVDSFTAKIVSGADAYGKEFEANSPKEVANSLRKMGDVKILVLTGHGEQHEFGTTIEGRTILDIFTIGDAFAPILNGEIPPPERIVLVGCKAGSGTDSIARKISGILKNVEVWAPKTNIPAPINTLPEFLFRVHKNGRIIRN